MFIENKILFIGAVNANNLPLGGEEYKNQLIVSYFDEKFKKLNVIDTFHWKKSIRVKVELIYNVFLKNYTTIVISASSVSTYKLLVLITKFKPNLKKKVVYLVIGGYLPEAIDNGIFKKNIYRGLKSIIIEGQLLKDKLTKCGIITPIHVLPNFKSFPKLPYPKKSNNRIFKFVYVGRISLTKGVNEILLVAEKIKLSHEDLKFEIDFYGPMEDSFDFQGVCKYKGYLNFITDSEKSYLILHEYDCILFPTTWQGEGFPGVLIDAFASALPVIATDWNINSEIVCNEKNGFLISVNRLSEELEERMVYAIQNRDLLYEIGEFNLTQSLNYHTDVVLPELLDCVIQ